MFCSECGTKLDEGDLFCHTCGTKRQATENEKPASLPNGTFRAESQVLISGKSKNKLKIGILIGAAAFVVIIAVSAVLLLMKPSSTLKITGQGNFTSPEAAIEHFFTAISNNDMESALSACAINEAARNFNAGFYIERMGILDFSMGAPSEYEFYQSLNEAYFLNQIARQLKLFTYSLVESEAANELSESGKEQVFSDSVSAAADFVKGTDPAVLNDLKIERMDLPYPSVYETIDNKKSLKNLAKIYGADEMTDRVMLFELNGTLYYTGFTVLRYGWNWKIITLQSAIGGTSPYGSAVEISDDEYLEIISG